MIADNKIPSFIAPTNIHSMSDEELDALLTNIRQARISASVLYARTMEEKHKVTQEKLLARIDKKCEQIATLISRHEKLEELMQQRVNELRGLRIQSEIGYA